MKETTKNKICDLFLKFLEKEHPELTEGQRWQIASALSKMANDVVSQTNNGISESYHKSVLELEQHRTQFKEHIEFIDKSAKTMLESFKRQGFVKVNEDSKTRKKTLVGRTSMVTEMADFLNKLNGSVMDFYKNVYKIEEDTNLNNFGISQTTLF